MWKKERDIWEEEDKRIKAKISQINKETMNYLKQQQDAKAGKGKKMDPTEKGMNKALMKEIKAKKEKMKQIE